MKRRKKIKIKYATPIRAAAEPEHKYSGLLALFRREGLIDDQNRSTVKGKQALQGL
jgi:hypothetical protein